MNTKMKVIRYEMPGPNDESVYHTFTLEDAIAIQRKRAIEIHDYVYETDKDALEDFITLNWAYYVEEKQN